MKSLQEMKQKGRALRTHLEAAFGTKVSLSQAYEALAAMEGAANWNVFSAGMVAGAGTTALPSSPLVMPAPASVVYDLHIGLPENVALMRAVCAQAWENCEATWEGNHGKGFEYVIDSTDICAAMASLGLVASDEEEGYLECAENQVELAMLKLGYHQQARLLHKGKAKFGEQFALNQGGVFFPATDWPAGTVLVSVFEQDRDGRWRHLQANSFLHFATDVLELVPGYQGRMEERGVNGKAFLQHEAQAFHEAAQLLSTLGTRAGDCIPVFVHGIECWIADNRPHLVPELDRLAQPNEAALEPHVCMLNIMEISLVSLLNDYDRPEEVEEWKWVEQHHAFAHTGNGDEAGTWEFMVHVDTALLGTDPIPPQLKPFFELANQQKAPWILFHQN